MGLATARAFAEAGAAVVLADVTQALVQRVAEELVADGHRAIGVYCDVSDDAQVAAMVDRTVAEFGRLDAAFNNAGVMAAIRPDGRQHARGVGARHRHQPAGCLELHEARAAPDGSARRWSDRQLLVGRSFTGNPGIPSYIASKHGVIGLTRTAALEYATKGIRVNAVCPGAIDTQIARDVVGGNEEAYEEMAKQVPLGRIGRPEEIASAVLWLCSPGASYVVGHALVVDGGSTAL